MAVRAGVREAYDCPVVGTAGCSGATGAVVATFLVKGTTNGIEVVLIGTVRLVDCPVLAV